MTERAKKYLYDILSAINAIYDFLEGVNFTEYCHDLKTKSAVERQLGIVGEAVNKFSNENEAEVLKHTRDIINFRNRLIHAYDNIDDSIVWAIKTNHLNELKKEIEDLLN